MNEELQDECRYFVTYSGVKLPLKLSQPLKKDALNNRNTFFRGYFDTHDRISSLQKMVYGEIELEHRYEYYDNGILKQAEVIDAEGEITILLFDKTGMQKNKT